MEIAKAVVLAGRTEQDRPWPSVRSGPKQLVPVANRPILFHNLEALSRAGVRDATIALDDESADAVVAAVGDGSRWGLEVRYVGWQSASGTTGALSEAREYIADQPVLVQPADALHRDVIRPQLAAFARERLDAMALTIPRAASRSSVAGYLFSPRAVSMLLDGCGAADPYLVVRRRGGHVRAQAIDGCLACHGGQEQLLEGNRRMLERLQECSNPADFPDAEIQGPVLIHPTAVLDGALVRGPAVIGPDARLSHAYVGPYSSIGPAVRIEGTEVEHSIVLDHAQLLHVGARIDSSVIGRGAHIRRRFPPAAGLRLSVGEGADITLS